MQVEIDVCEEAASPSAPKLKVLTWEEVSVQLGVSRGPRAGTCKGRGRRLFRHRTNRCPTARCTRRDSVLVRIVLSPKDSALMHSASVLHRSTILFVVRTSDYSRLPPRTPAPTCQCGTRRSGSGGRFEVQGALPARTPLSLSSADRSKMAAPALQIYRRGRQWGPTRVRSGCPPQSELEARSGGAEASGAGGRPQPSCLRPQKAGGRLSAGVAAASRSH